MNQMKFNNLFVVKITFFYNKKQSIKSNYLIASNKTIVAYTFVMGNATIGRCYADLFRYLPYLFQDYFVDISIGSYHISSKYHFCTGVISSIPGQLLCFARYS